GSPATSGTSLGGQVQPVRGYRRHGPSWSLPEPFRRFAIAHFLATRTSGTSEVRRRGLKSKCLRFQAVLIGGSEPSFVWPPDARTHLANPRITGLARQLRRDYAGWPSPCNWEIPGSPHHPAQAQ